MLQFVNLLFEYLLFTRNCIWIFSSSDDEVNFKNGKAENKVNGKVGNKGTKRKRETSDSGSEVCYFQF